MMLKNLDTMEKRNTLKHSLDTIKLSKLQNKNKKKKNSWGGGILCKLDIEKAYDHVN